MNIYALQDYAKEHGFNTGHFVSITSNGIIEFKWLDAFFGFIQVVQPDIGEGFITIDTIVELFGYDQKYTPTIGYDNS